MKIRNLLFGVWFYISLFVSCSVTEQRDSCSENIASAQLAAFSEGADFCGSDVACIKSEATQRILITAEYVSACEKANATGQMP